MILISSINGGMQPASFYQLLTMLYYIRKVNSKPYGQLKQTEN